VSFCEKLSQSGKKRRVGKHMTIKTMALGRSESPSSVKPLRGRDAAGRAITLGPDRDAPPSDSLTIRLADTDGQRSGANMLLSRMYSWRGYGRKNAVDASPNCVTFTAACKEDVVGTLTLAVDSAAGLAADKTFAVEVAPFRAAPGAKLCELNKLAFDWAGSSHRHLAALFHLVFIYGSRQFACTDLFIEVNPRHRRYYESMLGFVPVGEVRTNASVNAPSQLMWLNVGSIRRMIDHHTMSPATAQRSLYRYFFSPDEEDGLYGRLTGAPARGAAPDLGAVYQHVEHANSAKRLLGLVMGARLK
jgi:hypothetical protein